MHPRKAARSVLGRRITAAIAAFTLGGAFALAGATPATAATAEDSPVSWAEGRILSGSALGVNLDSIAAIQPAQAANYGNQPTQTSKDPLKVTALDAATVGDGSSVQTSVGDVVQLGAVGQYAEALADGTSFGASGSVTDDGAVGVGENKSAPGDDATVDLNALLGDQFASTLVDLQLAIGAIAAQAQADGQNATGDYTLVGLKLRLTSPAISALTDKVNAALDEVDSSLAILDGDDGLLALNLNKLLQRVDPALNLLGGDANVTASVDVGNLREMVSDLLTAQYAETGVTFNLDTGVVTIDLDAFAGGGLNNAAPGTEVLSPAFINPILNSITGKVSHIADQVVETVEGALHDAVVEVHANIDLDIAQSPLVQKVCTTIQQVIHVPTQIVTHVDVLVPVVDGVVAQLVNGVPVINGVPIVGDLLGGSLGGLLGGGHTVTWITQTVTQTVTELVDKTVDKVVCDNEITALPTLETSARIDISGTVDQFLGDSGVDANAKVKVLGLLNTELNLGTAIDGIADDLVGTLFDGDGAIQKLMDALNTSLVDPATEGLLTGEDAIGIALSDLLSITINNQELSGGVFTETALRITVLGGFGDGGLGGLGGGGLLGTARAANGLAVINLAQASVGPNVTAVEDPCIDCEVGGDVTTPPGDPGDPGGIFGAPGGFLAMTGAGIAMLVGMILALVAAGAYLMREGYRNRRGAVSTD